MKKVNLLSRADMKKVMGGVDPEFIDIGGTSMHCRDKDQNLIKDPFSVSDCSPTLWDGYCTGITGYDKSKSNCNSW